MSKAPRNHETLIEALGDPTKLATAIGVPRINVAQWKRRNRIPPEAWQRVLEASTEQGVKGVTLQWLLDTMPDRAAPSTRPTQQEAA